MKPSKRAALKDLGLEEREARRCEELANIPEKKFEKFVADTRAKGERITASAPLKLARLDDKAKLAAELRGKPLPLATGRFDVIVAGDDGFGRKPSPGPFQRALEVLGRSSQQAIYIGDRIDDDCGGAHGAGLRAFLIDRHQVYHDDAGNGESTYVRLRSLLDLLDHLSSGEVMEESQCLSPE